MESKRKGNIYIYARLPSTQDEAWALAAGGAPPGTVVLAREQTAARGRSRRDWVSPPGGLWFSLLHYPESHPAPSLLTLAAARALVRALRENCALDASLRLPNDLFVGSRKLAGIIAEVRGEKTVIGVGVNVNCPAAGFPFPAVSVREVTGRRASRWRLLTGFLACFQVGRAASGT